MNHTEKTRRIFIGAFIQSETLKPVFEMLKKDFSENINAKWTRSTENFHITFHFFGAMPIDKIAELSKILNAHFKYPIKIPIKIDGVDYFSGKNKPKILYLKIDEPTGELYRIYRQLQKILFQNGFIAQKTDKFVPHITLARIKKADKGFFDKILNRQKLKIGNIKQIKIEIIESILQPEGAIYKPLNLDL